MAEQQRGLRDIKDRAFDFAVRIVKLVKLLEKSGKVSKTLCGQLLNAGTSVGANLEEAVAGQSRADFVHKSAIALKEARESNYWLRLIIATTDLDEVFARGIAQLEQESGEIAKIIGKRIVSTKMTDRDT